MSRPRDSEHVVGESERMVREIFATAREKRSEGFMPFLLSMKLNRFLARARVASFKHSFDAGPDVLLGDGRDRFTQRRRHYPCFQSRRSNRPAILRRPNRSKNKS